MANILDRYGIKEVADVTFFEIGDSAGVETYTPVLYLDTLKISTIEETAEQTEARGGKGNAPLIVWDYGKEINISIQDALFSPKSMAMMHIDLKDQAKYIDVTTSGSVTRYVAYKGGKTTIASALEELKISGSGVKAYPAGAFTTASGVTALTANTDYIIEYTVPVDNKTEITISADSFPGTYKIVGDTYARSQTTGKDEYFQFEIPKAKMSAETTITLEAEGDPSVFDMNMKVLRPANGEMMKLIQYTVAAAK